MRRKPKNEMMYDPAQRITMPATLVTWPPLTAVMSWPATMQLMVPNPRLTMTLSRPQTFEPQIPNAYRHTAICRRPVGAHKVAVNAGITEPRHAANTLTTIESLTDSPKIGPRMPMVSRPGEINMENQKNII